MLFFLWVVVIQSLPYNLVQSTPAPENLLRREQQTISTLSDNRQKLLSLREDYAVLRDGNQTTGEQGNALRSQFREERELYDATKVQLAELRAGIQKASANGKIGSNEYTTSPAQRATPNNPFYRTYRVYDDEAKPQLLSLINADRSGNIVNVRL